MVQDKPDAERSEGASESLDKPHNASGPSSWKSACAWLCFVAPGVLWRATLATAENLYNLIVKLPWVFAIVVILAILVRGLTQYVTVIEPISVPRKLAEDGYTPEVAGRRLRDALFSFGRDVNSRMQNPDVALHGELPNVVVPTVGISLDAVVVSLRSMLRITRSRSISGEFTIAQDKLWLRLRINNREYYASAEGGDPAKPDELLRQAVPETLKIVQPYLVAVWLGRSDETAALALIDEIVKRPSWDPNVAWAHNLRSSIFWRHKNYPKAIEAAENALKIDKGLVVAHNNLGLAFKDSARPEQAIAAFRKAIELDPGYAFPQNNLGLVLTSQGRHEEAIAAYRKAIELDRKYAVPHNNLGIVLRTQGKNEEAIAAYRKSIELDPKYAYPYNNMGLVLRAQGKDEEAIAAYREAIRLDAKYAVPHNNLGLILSAQGKREEAIASYREAVRIDPKYAAAQNNLGVALERTARDAEAIAAYREAIALNPQSVLYRNNLARLLLETDEDKEAAIQYQEILKIDPNHSAAREALERMSAGNSANK